MQEIPGDRLKSLAKKMLTGTITPAEQRELQKWLSANPGNDLVWELADTNEEELRERLFSSIIKDSGAALPVVGKKTKKYYWSVAASLLILLAAGLYFALPSKKIRPTILAATLPPAD